MSNNGKLTIREHDFARGLRKVGIFGTGSALPTKIISNHDLEKLVDTSDEWIRTRTGISERRVVENGMTTSDLACAAAKKALADASMKPEDLDLIIVGTITPDQVFPSTACEVQYKLGAMQAAAFDLSAACSGFLYSITVGWNMVATGAFENVLVIGAESLSRVTDYTDRNSCILFGDGAGAVVLKETKGPKRILFSILGARGSDDEVMILPGGGSKIPASHKSVDERLHFMRLRGKEVFKFAVSKMADLVETSAKHLGIKPSDIKLIVPHQVNQRIIEAAMGRLDLPMEKVFLNINKYGNTSAASVPIAIDESFRSVKLDKGDIVVILAFGAGLTWGACAIEC